MASKKVLTTLQKLRGMETTASLQYMNHYHVLKFENLGFIAEYMEKTAIQEMKHAEETSPTACWISGMTPAATTSTISHTGV